MTGLDGRVGFPLALGEHREPFFRGTGCRGP